MYSTVSSDSPPPESDECRSTGHPFWDHVARATDRFDQLVPFLAVPVLLTFLEFQKVERALAGRSGSVSISLEFNFPAPLLDLWSFADPPERHDRAMGPEPPTDFGPSAGEPTTPTSSTGSTFDSVDIDLPMGVADHAATVSGLEFWLVIASLFFVYGALIAVISAIYVGGIHRRLAGKPASPWACARTYAIRFFAYTLILFGAFMLLVPLALVSPGLVLLAFPAIIVGMYLFYATPFLFVVANASVLEGFARSYRLAVSGGPYFTFAVWHVLVSVTASIVLSGIVSAGGSVGFVVALAVVAPLSLVLTAASVSFVHELVDGSDPMISGST